MLGTIQRAFLVCTTVEQVNAVADEWRETVKTLPRPEQIILSNLKKYMVDEIRAATNVTQ